MRIQVQRVSIPSMSTIGYGEGLDEHDRRVTFLGDHRPMRELGRALPNATEPIYAEVEDWQLVGLYGSMVHQEKCGGEGSGLLR